jgi:hypothetical protein
MNKTIKNINFIILKSSYHWESYEDNALFMDALFCTERLDFGGYSFAYVQQLASPLKLDDLRRFYLNEIAVKSYIRLDYDEPVVIFTDIVKNNIIEAKKLMDKIIQVSRTNNWRNIRLTQLIELKSKNNENNFKGIIQSVLNNAEGKELTIFIDIDERRYDEFCSLLDKYLD